MPFLTQGKTNWKFILIVIVFALVVGGGILGYQYWLTSKQEIKTPEMERPKEIEETVVKVIFPNGGERLKIGETYTIKWESSGIEFVNIYLREENIKEECYLNEEPIMASLGSYTFKLDKFMCRGMTGKFSPQPIEPRESGWYIINISVPYESGIRIEDWSDDYFSIVKDETADWQTYRNEEYGLEIQYSPIYQEAETSLQITEILIDGDIEEIENIRLPMGKEEAKTIVKSFCEPKILLGKYEYEEIRQRYDNLWFIPIFDVEYLYGATVDPQNGDTRCTKDLARVIFSEPLSDRDTADWEIYRDEEYRFEFKYPKDWKLVEQTTNFTEEVEAGTQKKIYLTSPIKWEMGDPLGIGEDWGEAPAELIFTILDEENGKEEWASLHRFYREIIFPSNIFAIISEDITCVAHHNYIYIPPHLDDQFFIKIFSFTPGSVWEIEEFNQVLSTLKFLD